MKLLAAIVSLFLMLTACNRGTADTYFISAGFSDWFHAHERDLYQEFATFVSHRSLCNTCDTAWSEMSYEIRDTGSLMGKFTRRVQAYNPEIRVMFTFRKDRIPNADILLTADYRKDAATAVDSAYTALDKPVNFSLTRFRPRNGDVDVYGFDNAMHPMPGKNRIEVRLSDIRINLSPDDELYDVTLILPGDPGQTLLKTEDIEYLVHAIFGEEILVRKINGTKVEFSGKDQTNGIGIDQAIKKLRQDIRMDTPGSPARMWSQ